VWIPFIVDLFLQDLELLYGPTPWDGADDGLIKSGFHQSNTASLLNWEKIDRADEGLAGRMSAD
jgi:hypothetical protein